jgi:hypothetical protein
VLRVIGELLKRSVILLYRLMTFRGTPSEGNLPVNMRRDFVQGAVRRAKQKTTTRQQNEAAEIARGDRRARSQEK